jgi:hypothetical protein
MEDSESDYEQEQEEEEEDMDDYQIYEEEDNLEDENDFRGDGDEEDDDDEAAEERPTWFTDPNNVGTKGNTTAGKKRGASCVWNHVFLLDEGHPVFTDPKLNGKKNKFTHRCAVPNCMDPFLSVTSRSRRGILHFRADSNCITAHFTKYHPSHSLAELKKQRVETRTS